jgi:hypothetical protein
LPLRFSVIFEYGRVDSVTEPTKPNEPLVFSAQDRVRQLAPYMERVLAALGYGRVLVTDESLVGDFFESYLFRDTDDPHAAAQKVTDDARLASGAAQLGVPVTYEDYIVEVAERLRDRAEEPKG